MIRVYDLSLVYVNFELWKPWSIEKTWYSDHAPYLRQIDGKGIKQDNQQQIICQTKLPSQKQLNQFHIEAKYVTCKRVIFGWKYFI